MVGRIRIRQLELFIEVARSGSISRIAQRLSIAQPSLTRMIHDLEDAVGTPLFERSRNGVQLNQYGRSFLDYAVAAVSEINNGVSQLAGIKTFTHGHVRIGVSMPEMNRLIPVAVAKMNKTNPGVIVTLAHGTQDELVSKLRHGQLDLVVGRWPSANPMADLIYETLFIERYVLVARDKHPLAKKKKVGISDLLSFFWVVPTQGSEARQQFDEFFREASIEQPKHYVEGMFSLFAREFVKQADAVALVPYSFVKEDLTNEILVEFDVGLSGFNGSIGFMKREGPDLPHAAKLLVTELRRAAASLGFGRSSSK